MLSGVRGQCSCGIGMATVVVSLDVFTTLTFCTCRIPRKHVRQDTRKDEERDEGLHGVDPMDTE